ncbi:MAG: hypothetical protein ACTSWN_01875 [Promethearchaeota archaeon]
MPKVYPLMMKNYVGIRATTKSGDYNTKFFEKIAIISLVIQG